MKVSKVFEWDGLDGQSRARRLRPGSSTAAGAGAAAADGQSSPVPEVSVAEVPAAGRAAANVVPILRAAVGPDGISNRRKNR